VAEAVGAHLDPDGTGWPRATGVGLRSRQVQSI